MTTSTPSRRPSRVQLLDALEAAAVIIAALPTLAALAVVLMAVLT